MSRSISQILVVLLLIVFGCTERGVSSHEGDGNAGSKTEEAEPATTGGPGASETGASGAEGSTTDSAGGTSSTSAGPPITCEDGWTPCDGECALLDVDTANCGECGHSCEGWGTSNRCFHGACEPGVWPCIKPDQGLETCAQACASVGQTCAVDAHCSGYVLIWMTHSANDEDPESTIEECERLVDGNTSFMQSCDDPIDWGYESFGKTVLGVACCCTQD
jgi:hypothetical protein